MFYFVGGKLDLREIDSRIIKESIKDLLLEANYLLPKDIKNKLIEYQKNEISSLGKDIMTDILKNAKLAENNKMAICQDTGMCIFFIEIGQEVHIKGEHISDCVNSAVREAYREGYLRNSIVKDPLNRENTGDNTPAIIYYDIKEGDKININVMPKGFGSENMSALKMLKPSDGLDGVVEFVLETIKKAGPNPCPPIIVGVGIGGTMEKAALLSKKALLRPLDVLNKDEFYAKLEVELLNKINNLGIGPQGMGGITTALGVNIEVYPTHIAGLPVAVNLSCHATRHAEITI